MSMEDCTTIVSELDTHGEGGINFVDFLKGMYDEHDRATTDEDIAFLFESIDADNDGFVDYNDVQLLFKKSGALVTKQEVGACRLLSPFQ